MLSGHRAVWEMENSEAEQEKTSEKGLEKAYKLSLQPHDLALLRTPDFGSNSETKTEEREGNRKKRRKMELKIFTKE